MTKEIIIGASSLFVCRNPTVLTCIGLGSCLAIALHDPILRHGALAHAMLPCYEEGIDKINPAKYVDTSVYFMVDELIRRGSSKKQIKAKLVGGAQMFSFISPNTFDVGRRNIQSAEHALKKEGVQVIAKDVGGKRGRTMSFDIKTGLIQVKKSGEGVVEI